MEATKKKIKVTLNGVVKLLQILNYHGKEYTQETFCILFHKKNSNLCPQKKLGKQLDMLNATRILIFILIQETISKGFTWWRIQLRAYIKNSKNIMDALYDDFDDKNGNLTINSTKMTYQKQIRNFLLLRFNNCST